MKKILTSVSALAMASAFATGAAAQQAETSVLERVLGTTTGLVSSLDQTTANTLDGPLASVFANIASTNVALIESTEVGDGISEIVGNIDGSINVTLSNTAEGVSDSTANVTEDITAAGDVLRSEIDVLTVDLGDMTTTVLGAVNTGDIDLAGAITSISETYNEAVISATAGLSSSLSDTNDNVFLATSNLLGDSENPVLMLNLADNIASIDGSITLAMDTVAGSTGNIGTTVLGAVNTGTITQDATTNLAGVVSSVVGMSN